MELSELKNTITKVKDSMDGLDNRIEGREEGTCELEDRTINITQSEIQRENRLDENEQRLRDLWAKRSNTVSLGSWKEKRECGCQTTGRNNG